MEATIFTTNIETKIQFYYISSFIGYIFSWFEIFFKFNEANIIFYPVRNKMSFFLNVSLSSSDEMGFIRLSPVRKQFFDKDGKNACGA